MTSNTFAIEVIIPRLEGDCDLIPSVRGLGSPYLTQESAWDNLIRGILERSSRNISPFPLVNKSLFFVYFFQMSSKCFICSVPKIYIEKAKASVHGPDSSPCSTAAVIYISPQSTSLPFLLPAFIIEGKI